MSSAFIILNILTWNKQENGLIKTPLVTFLWATLSVVAHLNILLSMLKVSIPNKCPLSNKRPLSIPPSSYQKKFALGALYWSFTVVSFHSGSKMPPSQVFLQIGIMVQHLSETLLTIIIIFSNLFKHERYGKKFMFVCKSNGVIKHSILMIETVQIVNVNNVTLSWESSGRQFTICTCDIYWSFKACPVILFPK